MKAGPQARRACDEPKAAAIRLAELLGASLLLVDERKGRAVARERGLNARGTLGVLVEARRAGHVKSLRAALEALQREGFRVAPALVAEALHAVGEK